MTKVTVDLEDLKTLVMAMGVIKQIENALNSFSQDPFAKPNQPLTDVHDRLANAMREAERANAGTLVNFDEPLSKEELWVLHVIAKDWDENSWCEIGPDEKAPQLGEQMSVYDQLMCKGCIKIGSIVTGIIFAGESRVSMLRPTTRYLVRITDRGIDKLHDALAEPSMI